MKKDENDETVKYKARYVARGFAQVFVSDCLDKFAPTIRFSSTRMFLALATHFHCDLFQIDVSSVCLKVDLEEDVHAEHPPDSEILGKEPKLLCKLLKRLYGKKKVGCFLT